jgi:oxygen-independent coproporphyrinogen-3 oxidase
VIQPPRELLDRYGVVGPRYTSYPAAPYWGAPPSAEGWIAAIDAALAPQAARAGLYVHLPFCPSLCTFCGCNMRVARSHSLAAPYVDKLIREYGFYRQRLARKRLPLARLHLGGGTPTWLPEAELDRLLTHLLTDVAVADDADFAVEADPRNTTRSKLAILNRHGFRHIVIGVQDFDARVLEIVNRLQSEEEVRRTIEDARELGFTSIGVDFICGLPLQTLESVRASLTTLLRFRPDRVNYLPYVHVPWIKPSQRQYTEADLPDTTLRRELYLLGRESLAAAGYVEIGFDQYALPHDPLARALAAGRLTRSFMGFAPTPVDALVGLGVSAIGDTPTMYAQNEKNLQRYETRVTAGELPLQRGHVLDAEDRLIRGLLSDLLGNRAASLSGELRQSSWWPAMQRGLEGFARDGLLEMSADQIRVTALGRAFLARIGMALDRRLHESLAE